MKRTTLLLAAFSIIALSVISYLEFFANNEISNQRGAITLSGLSHKSASRDIAHIQDQRLTAQKHLETLLLTMNKLELLNPHIWAADHWKEIEQLLDEGERQYRATRYHLAKKKYHRANIIAKELADRAEILKVDKLREGNLAIKNGDSVKAERAFKIALSIEPNNTDGLNGLKRTKVLEEVKVLLAQGKKYEKTEQLSKAKKFYESALRLDENALGAKVALVRINFKLRPTYYRSYMSSGLKLVRENRLEEAEIFVRKAQAIENRTETAELLSLIESKRLTSSIKQHLKQANAAEKKENWNLAVKSFNSAIRLDPAMTGVIKKKEKAEARALLDQNIEMLLTEQNDLTTRADFEIAKSLLNQARISVPRQKRIRVQIKKLEEKIKTSETTTATKPVHTGEKKPN